MADDVFVFTKLAESGQILMPFEETFFAPKFGMTADKFGMTADKFGVRWMVSVAPVVIA